MTQLVAGFYGAHPGFCNVILDTLFSLLTAIFTFIVLPAGDFIIGQEPPEAVRGPLVSLGRSRLLACLRVRGRATAGLAGADRADGSEPSVQCALLHGCWRHR